MDKERADELVEKIVAGAVDRDVDADGLARAQAQIDFVRSNASS